ncbi:MAG: TolC family protein, partial [Acidobacteriota bacterium]|nr:TolC family protein [Acidobacteriota bacterium]
MIRSSLIMTVIAALPLLVPAPAVAQGGTAAEPSYSQSAPVVSVPELEAPQTGNAFTGSVPEQLVPGVLKISLQDAIQRGLQHNLGLLLADQNRQMARGQRWQELSRLLPNLNASSYMDSSKVDLAEFGFTGFPGVPPVVGPFAYFDARAYLTQSVFNWESWNGARAAAENVKSTQYTYQNARDLVVLAVGFAYVQAIADQATVQTTTAQLNTAQALYQQASDQVQAGTAPSIDALRANVELQTQQQALIQANNDLAIQKLNLARAIGLAPGQQFDLTENVPYKPLAGLSVDEALKQADASRPDYQAALASVRAAQNSRRAAEAEYLPSLSFNADYGLAGTYPNVSTHGIFDVRGTLTIPIFRGGRVRGDVLQASARLQQAREQLDDLRAQIDAQVRTALLNLESAEQRVNVAQSNVDLAEQALTQSRDRFAAGVTNTVEVVQAEQQVASAHQQYIS